MRWLLLMVGVYMAGDVRYGGFDNQQLSAYLGIPVSQVQMLQELMQGKGTQADYGLAQQLASAPGGGPMGGANQLENILAGFDHLQQHPLGSKHHGFNPTDLIANVATGGLYGAGKAGLDALTGKENLFDAAKGGLNQLGPWGSSTYNIPGVGPQLAQTGNLIGAGAGIAGGGLAGTFSPSGFGTAGEVGGSNIPFLTDAAGNAGMNVAFDPVTGAAGPGTGITPAGYAAGEGGASLAPGMIRPGGSPLMGASLGQGIGNMFGLGGGGTPGVPGSPPMGATQSPGQGPSQAQLAALGASTPHTGLAPKFEARMKGAQEQPGLADPQDLSLAALWGMANK